MSNSIFEAAREGDLETLKHLLSQNPDLTAKNEYGFTALQCAAMGANSVEKSVSLEVIRLLVEAGSPLESIDGKRSVLYLAVEFAAYPEAVKYLLEAGANPNVYSEYGIHIVQNAMLPEIQQLLSELTGVAIPPPPEPRPTSQKMNAESWKKAKLVIDKVFADLSKKGLICLQNAGTTQDDAFSDCYEKYHQSSCTEEIKGFCFYTGQDLSRAKRSSELVLGFWGAPDGNEKSMIAIGKMICDCCTEHELKINWGGSGSTRPSLYLHAFNN